jgi:hypothetical protein
MTQQQTPQQMINGLASFTGTPAFPHIALADVVNGLNARIANPWTQDQKSSSLCGPSALLYCLLNDHPDQYVQYVIDLYTKGKAKLGTLGVHPGKDCRNYNPPSNKIAAVDWIALASLRDSENSVLDYQSVDDTTAGITMPHSLAAWFKALGYKNVCNVTNIFFTKGRNDIDSCNQQKWRGRWICLFINDQMLTDATAKSRSFAPDHWVVMNSVATTANDNVSVLFYTWGDPRWPVPRAGALAVKHFCRNFYGYVSASP